MTYCDKQFMYLFKKNSNMMIGYLQIYQVYYELNIFAVASNSIAI